MKAALTRYRVMAYIVGVLLLLLVFVHVPLHYIWHIETPIAILHGWMFMIYVVTVIDLAFKCKWQIFPRTFLIAIAGTIPFLSFVAEHKATQWARAAISASEQGSDAPTAGAQPSVADN
jgi:integral membrane protein